jgi:L-threonylcarbamoyladenylate synthase
MSYSGRAASTRLVTQSPPAIEEASDLIRAGQLVAFPTETVYGLGANALDDLAVGSIFAAKQRPRINPLIVHVLDTDEAAKLVEFNRPATALAQAFWPGGVTLVLPRRADCPLSLLVSAGLDSAAVRAPAHPVARELLNAAKVPIAAPSANLSGSISPTTAEHALIELNGKLPMILDGGACEVGLESTIIGFDGERPVLLRKGAVAREAIEQVVGPLGTTDSGELRAPGMMASHYAPKAQIRLNAESVEDHEALLAFGDSLPAGNFPTLNLSPSGDLTEAASNLFSMLRILDHSGTDRIAVMPIPNAGLGEAINDRLARAAAPRD